MTFKKITDEHGDWLCTDTRKWPIKEYVYADNPGEPGVRYTEFHLRVHRLIVESGWEVSVIWNTGSYTENKFADLEERPFVDEPQTVEMALFNRHGDMMGDPAGWVNQEDFAKFMDLINTLSSDWKGDIQEPLEFAQKALPSMTFDTRSNNGQHPNFSD